MKKTAKDTAEIAKLGIKKAVEKSRYPCIIHTSSNTGSKKGSLIKIAREVGKYLLLLACRHHIIELRMVHFCEAVIKKNSVGPENPLFVKFKHV